MTFKEEFEKKHPGGFNLMMCPRDQPFDTCDKELRCVECWNREIPSEKTKEEEKQTIKDSGERRKFETGAVRDMAEGKGRFDLLPLDVLGTANQDNRLTNLAWYQKTNDETYLYASISDLNYKMDYTLIARIARHFEDGAKKYDENNWRKGLPCKCYIDSAARHYFKWILKETDEDHEAAFYWNIMCCIWTHENIPEMQSYKKEVD